MAGSKPRVAISSGIRLCQVLRFFVGHCLVHGPLHLNIKTLIASVRGSILDNTERCGISLDHQGICKFHSPADQGFRTAVAALRRYTRDAPSVIQRRYQRSANVQRDEKMPQAAELLGTIPPRIPGPCQIFAHSLEAADGVFLGKTRGPPSSVQQRSNLKDCIVQEG